jgi:hypothetical protein
MRNAWQCWKLRAAQSHVTELEALRITSTEATEEHQREVARAETIRRADAACIASLETELHEAQAAADKLRAEAQVAARKLKELDAALAEQQTAAAMASEELHRSLSRAEAAVKSEQARASGLEADLQQA